MDPSLLTPSLSGQQFRPIYSRTALFAAAFLFGGYAVAIMAWLNASRLGRFKRDAPWLAVSFLGTAAVLMLTLGAETNIGADQRVFVRGAGFLVWLLFSYRHGTAYRAMETFGTSHPSPYKALAGAFVGSVLLLLATVAMYALLGGTIA